MSTLESKILDWYASGERGVSSEAMACAVTGRKPDATWSGFGNHPSDAADFSRCAKLLIAVPEARQHLDKVAALSKKWKILVNHWDELELLYHKELSGTSYNHELYARMKALLA